MRYTIPHKVHVDVDPGIVRLARALVPKTIRLQRPRWDPHITVVRNEAIPNLTVWGRHEGSFVEFEYDSYVHCDDTYYWVRVFCPALTQLRLDLGLPESSELTRAPDGFESFHITIGNLKI